MLMLFSSTHNSYIVISRYRTQFYNNHQIAVGSLVQPASPMPQYWDAPANARKRPRRSKWEDDWWERLVAGRGGFSRMTGMKPADCLVQRLMADLLD